MKKLYQNDVVENLLRKFNPFGLRSKNGMPYEFMRVSEIYLFVMVKLYTMSPRGYIEIPLFISELYAHLSFSECKACAGQLESLGVEPVMHINYETKEGKQKIENILKGLHFLCETSFDSASFTEAYRLLLNRIELEKVKKKDEDRDN